MKEQFDRQIKSFGTMTLYRLNDEELANALYAGDNHRRIIALRYSPETKIFNALSGDCVWFSFTKKIIEKHKVMGEPNFLEIKIIDGGHTIAFGEHYEVSADGLIYYQGEGKKGKII